MDCKKTLWAASSNRQLLFIQFFDEFSDKGKHCNYLCWYLECQHNLQWTNERKKMCGGKMRERNKKIILSNTFLRSQIWIASLLFEFDVIENWRDQNHTNHLEIFNTIGSFSGISAYQTSGVFATYRYQCHLILILLNEVSNPE